MPGNKGKEVALVASSSAGKSNMKKGNKEKKPQIPSPSNKIAKQKGKTKADSQEQHAYCVNVILD